MQLLKLITVSAFVLCAVTACGGGGGGNTASSAAKTTVSGIATKGPFVKGSSVSVFAVTNGSKGALIIKTVTSDDNGSYSADLGSYTGPIIVEVSGSYLDEATGTIAAVSNTAPLRAVLPQAQGTVTLPVTPLTELAVRKTGGALNNDSITAANNLVSSVFKVDIINTVPLSPVTKAPASAAQAQKDYTLALAAISQMVSTSAGATDTDKLNSALATLSQGITSAGMSSGTAAKFQVALSDFIKPSNSHNQTGITDISASSLVNVGAQSKSYTLSLQGAGSTGAAKGIQLDLVIPAGATVDVNSSDSTIPSSSFALSGNMPSDVLFGAKYSSGTVTIVIITTKGIISGEFATLTCNIRSGAAIPPASAIIVNNLRLIDSSGNAIKGASVIVQ